MKSLWKGRETISMLHYAEPSLPPSLPCASYSTTPPLVHVARSTQVKKDKNAETLSYLKQQDDIREC
jgi:hypothetical protein